MYNVATYIPLLVAKKMGFRSRPPPVQLGQTVKKVAQTSAD